MPDTRRVLSIKPSWRHQQILLLGHIALLVCVWPLLFGFYPIRAWVRLYDSPSNLIILP